MKKIILSALILLSTATPLLASTKADDYFQMGNIFATSKDYDKAIDAFLSAAAADPAAYAVRANLSVAIMLGQKKDYDKAAKVLEMIIDKHADYPELYLVYKILGKVRVDQKRPADAITAFETYLRLVPTEKIKEKDRADVEKQITSLRQQAGG